MTGQTSSAPSALAQQGNAEPAEPVSDYQPGDHTVAEVEDYVTDHPDERGAVLEAEVAGKDRVTLVDWLKA